MVNRLSGCRAVLPVVRQLASMGLSSISVSAPPVELSSLTLEIEGMLPILKRTLNNLKEPLEFPLSLWKGVVRDQRNLEQLCVHDLGIDEIPDMQVINVDTQPMPDRLEIVPPLMGTTITIMLVTVIS